MGGTLHMGGRGWCGAEVLSSVFVGWFAPVRSCVRIFGLSDKSSQIAILNKNNP
jgi:hypothetical protein